MRKKLYISAALAILGLYNNVNAISGTFYTSLANNTGDALSTFLYHAVNGTDRWDNCGWWVDEGWAAYASGVCTKSRFYTKLIDNDTIIGQTGGHTSNFGSTSGHQEFVVRAGNSTKFTMWNDVDGSGDEHLRVKMWCNGTSSTGTEKLHFYTRNSTTLFVRTMFQRSATNNKVDVGYIIVNRDVAQSNKPDMDIDLFDEQENGASDFKVGYIKDCFDGAHQAGTLPIGSSMAIHTSSDRLYSPSRKYFLSMQGDGNLVIYNSSTNKSIWATGTMNKGAVRADIQSDGNFVLYTSSNVSVWATHTHGRGVTYLALGDDGNLGLYNKDGWTVWSRGGFTPNQ